MKRFFIDVLMVVTALFVGVGVSLGVSSLFGLSSRVGLAAASFRYGCALAWVETPGAESKDAFVRRMAEKALAKSHDDAAAPIWREAIRRGEEARQ